MFFNLLRIIKYTKMKKGNLKIFDNIIRQGKDYKQFYQIKKKDRDIFIKAYDRYVDEIYRFIYFKISNAEEAQDITSAVFLKAWNSLRDDNRLQEKTLAAYFYRIARNSVIDHYRKNKPVSSIEEGEEENFKYFKDESQDIEKDVVLKSEMENVYKMIDRLKDEYKEIVILKYINELSLKEISNITGKSRNNVRVITHRALKALRELIEEEK